MYTWDGNMYVTLIIDAIATYCMKPTWLNIGFANWDALIWKESQCFASHPVILHFGLWSELNSRSTCGESRVCVRSHRLLFPRSSSVFAPDRRVPCLPPPSFCMTASHCSSLHIDWSICSSPVWWLHASIWCVLCITGGVFICVRLSCQQSWYTDINASLGWLQLASYHSSIIPWILCYPLLASCSYGSESFILLHICVFLTNKISLSYQLSLLTSSHTPLLGHMDHIDIQTVDLLLYNSAFLEKPI